MIYTYNMLKDKYKSYLNINDKILNDTKKGELIKLKKGLYETDKNVKPYLLASSIYGPSYISFDFALYLYDMIPEKVVTVTSAVTGKNKNKIFNNDIGTYTYSNVPEEVYPLDVELKIENGYSYQIATREKALCDKLLKLPAVKNQKELEHLLFDNLRIDKEEFNKLDVNKIEILSEKYPSFNVKLLYKYMRRIENE